ncbi:MAG: LETM1 domain-containing protein [Deltaproteobacteria bacterium]|nr:LETM1 domain-containing protein [Deltaproteobacteria bacterium]
MELDRSGWFKKYTQFRMQHPFPNILPTMGVKVLEDTGVHNEMDQAIYYFLEPTGILYGFSTFPPFARHTYEDIENISPLSRANLSFMESLFAVMVADRHYLLEELNAEPDHFAQSIQVAMEYFLNGPAFDGGNRWGLFWPTLPWRRGDVYYHLEQAIWNRVGKRPELFHLPGYRYNSFLFLDLYYCLMLQRRVLVDPEGWREGLMDLNVAQSQTREYILRLILMAAYSSGAIEPKERKIITWYFRSSGLPGPLLKNIQREITRTSSLKDFEIPEMSWMVRRFVLELVLMILEAERGIDEREILFAHELIQRLGLWEEELTQSITAMELFIHNSRQQLKMLSDRSTFLNIGENLHEMATIAFRKNMTRIMNEVNETKELYNLLIKATHMKLSPEERHKVNNQLMDIVKTIPALAIFALPGGGLVLPILLRLLPFNLLPSSFED